MKIKSTLILLCSFLFLINKSFACPCDSTQTVQEHIDGANQIFVGTVIGINTNWISGGMKYSFEVEKTWKRGADKLLVVNTGWDYECGSVFTEGEKYLIYGQKKFSLKTNACMGTKLLADAEEDLRLLGEGASPRKSAVVPIAGWGMGLMILVAMLFLAFIIFKKNSHRSSKSDS